MASIPQSVTFERNAIMVEETAEHLFSRVNDLVNKAHGCAQVGDAKEAAKAMRAASILMVRAAKIN